jgi:hypothetical protein
MKTRSSRRARRTGLVALAFALAFLACGTAVASEIEWQLPMLRDAAGSGMTLELSREGTRRTATPFFTLYEPTVWRIEERIWRMIDRLAARGICPEASAGNPSSRTGLSGTPAEDSGRPDTVLSPLPPVPEEITVRSVKRFLKELRASRREKPAPAAAAVPELRVGRTDTSPRGN